MFQHEGRGKPTSAVLGTLSQKTSILMSPWVVCRVADIAIAAAPLQHGRCWLASVFVKRKTARRAANQKVAVLALTGWSCVRGLQKRSASLKSWGSSRRIYAIV